MGINKSFDDPFNQSPKNGHDTVYRDHTYRDYIFNKRPTAVKAKRFVVFFSIDLIALFTIAGIINHLTDIKEIIALFVAIAYLVVRLAIITVKLFAFVGKNHEGISKGWKALKKILSE